jgi:hypothetical protein
VQASRGPGRLIPDRLVGVVAQHVGNARRRERQGRTSIAKGSPDSSHKIDAPVRSSARMVRRLVLASKAWQERQRRRKGQGRVFAQTE